MSQDDDRRDVDRDGAEAPDQGSADAGPVVTTESGPVRGVAREEGETTSLAFLGIPYAAAPVGELRFAPPQPVEPWWGVVRDAAAPGATPLRHEVPDALIPEPAVPGRETLNLNVFTPSVDGELPVLVWIHGDGFVSGSQNSPWYDGAAFNRDGVVTVSVSYRLGCEGFGVLDEPGADGDPAGDWATASALRVSNLGVLDWLAALQWVRRNIEAFGGDPRRVTIGGQSAGGTAVLSLLSMPEAQPLFARALAISPTLVDAPLPAARARTRRVAEQAKVPATVEGFRGVDEEALSAAQHAADSKIKGMKALREAMDGSMWGPSIDGEIVERGTLDALRAGVGSSKPLLIGAARDEVGMMADAMPEWMNRLPASWLVRGAVKDVAARRGYLQANRRLVAEGTSILLAKLVTDAVFRRVVPAVADARAERAAAGQGAEERQGTEAETWVYGFGWRSPRNGWAHHCLDLPFWFDCLDDPSVTRVAGQRPRQALADAMHGAAARFIRGETLQWPAWTAERRGTQVFGANEILDVQEGYYDGAMPLVPGLENRG